MKRILSILLCLSMLLSMIPVNAFAADTEETLPAVETVPQTTAVTEPAETATATGTEETDASTQSLTEETDAPLPEETREDLALTGFTWVPEVALPSDDELFAGYAEAVFYGRSHSLLGNAAGSQLTGDVKLAYDALVPMIRQIASGQRSSTVLSVGQTISTYVPDVPVSFTGSSFGSAELSALFHALLADLPYELYWFDKTNTGGISGGYVAYKGKLYVEISFAVSCHYSLTGGTDTCEADTEKTGAAAAAAANAKAIAEEYADASDYQKLLGFKNQICNLTDYNHSAASKTYTGGYGDPWQLIWVFDGVASTKVVCEGYSKAFQYLCDLSSFDNNITCYNVVGTMSGGDHMWNIVTVNGSSYLVDVTNCDGGYALFLRGGKPNASGAYVFAGSTFVYGSETTALWGTGADSILTLATSNLTASTFPTGPEETPPEETDPAETEPEETAPDETEPDDGIMTGGELVSAMEGSLAQYILTQAVEVSSDIVLPEEVMLDISAPGSITVLEGGSLTVSHHMKIGSGGSLTVNAGGSLTVIGSVSMEEGGAAAIAGTLNNNGRIDVNNGSLTVTGSFVPGTDSYLVQDMGAAVTGIDKSHIMLTATVFDEASLMEALVLQEGYAAQNVILAQTGVPQEITGLIHVPEGVYLQLGYYLNPWGDIRITDGAQLINEGEIYSMDNISLTVEEGGTLQNDGVFSCLGPVSVSGRLVNCGHFGLWEACSLTIEESGLLNNGGTLCSDSTALLTNKGTLSIGESSVLELLGTYAHGDAARVEVALVNGAPVCADPIPVSLQTLVFCGSEEAAIRQYLPWAQEGYPVQVTVNGDLTLTEDLTIPENASVCVTDSAVVTVPQSVTVTNSGEFILETGTALTVEGQWAGNLPVGGGTIGGGFFAIDQAEFEALLAAGGTVSISGILEITEDTLIPAGVRVELLKDTDARISPDVTLTLSGEGSSLILSQGARLTNAGTILCTDQGSILGSGGELINNRRIDVQKQGSLDLRSGAYTGSGLLYSRHSCDTEGTVSHATVLGIPWNCINLVAETVSQDAILREMIGRVEALMAEGSYPNSFAIRFAGNTTLSADLELPEYADPVIPYNCYLTVPEGMTLTDHSGMIVYGQLILEGNAVTTGFPMAANEGSIVNPNAGLNYYIIGALPEDVSFGISRTTALVGTSVELWLEGWKPATAEYFGDFTIEITGDTTGSADWGWTDNGKAVVYSYNPGTVTIRVTATDPYGAPLYSAAGELLSREYTLKFVNRKITMYTVEDEPDFYEENFFGLYPGSSLHLYANLTQNAADRDPELLWEYTEVGEDAASISLENGTLTVTVSETLKEAVTLAITVKTADDSAPYFRTRIFLRPRADTADIALNGRTVTGQTLLFDLNRDGSTVSLRPFLTPEAAYTENGLMSDRTTPLVQWKSSSTKVATVDGAGNVTFSGATGKVTITMTANFGSCQTAEVTFNVAALAQEIFPSGSNPTALVGGSSAAFTVTDSDGTTLKSSAVIWTLCGQNGEAVAFHPYASVTTAGKLTTKAVADETKVWLMAQVAGDERSARLAEPVCVTLHPAVSSLQILDSGSSSLNGATVLYDPAVRGSSCQLSWEASPGANAIRTLTWTSSKSSMAAIDENGLITVAENASGTVKFTLTAVMLNGRKITASFQMKFGTFTTDLDVQALLADGTEGNVEDLVICGGDAITFTASNVPQTVNTPGVVWSVPDKTYCSITSKGVLTTKTVNNPQLVTVLVQSKDGYSETISVTLMPKPVSVGGSTMEALLIYTDGFDTGRSYITKTTQILAPGTQMQVYATGDVTWNAAPASVAAIDSSGILRALASGTATVTARDAAGRQASFTLKVGKLSASTAIAQKKTGITEDLAVASGKSLDLAAAVTYSDGSADTKVTWSVSNSALASVSGSGRLTAAKNLTRPVTVTVWATPKDGNPYARGSLEVTITPPATAIELFGPFGSGGSETDVTNTAQSWDMLESTTFTLRAAVFPGNAHQAVKWTSSSSAIATIDEKGNVQCRKSGTVTFTATAADGSGKKASFKVTVRKTMEYLTLPESALIAGGKSLTLTKLEGYALDPLATNKTLAWTLTYPDGRADPSSVATLSKGVLKTKTVTQEIQVLVRAEATDGSGLAAQCTVRICPATTSVTILNAPSRMVIGTTAALTAVSLPDGSANVFTWKSSKPGIIAVDQEGNVTALAAGSATITATAADGSNKKASVTITVAAAS